MKLHLLIFFLPVYIHIETNCARHDQRLFSVLTTTHPVRTHLLVNKGRISNSHTSVQSKLTFVNVISRTNRWRVK